jgi:hypothetical protein
MQKTVSKSVPRYANRASLTLDRNEMDGENSM